MPTFFREAAGWPHSFYNPRPTPFCSKAYTGHQTGFICTKVLRQKAQVGQLAKALVKPSKSNSAHLNFAKGLSSTDPPQWGVSIYGPGKG